MGIAKGAVGMAGPTVTMSYDLEERRVSAFKWTAGGFTFVKREFFPATRRMVQPRILVRDRGGK